MLIFATEEEFIAEAHRRMDKVIDIVIGGRYQATVREIEAEMTACGIPFTQRDVPNYVEEDDEDIVGTVNIVSGSNTPGDNGD